jgi:transcriptional regulator with XRE-family HTH domain
MENADEFWNRVNQLIKSQKTKQEILASSCNISIQTFRGWITKKRFPSTPETYRIAHSLGVSTEYLITGKEPDASRKYIDRLEAIKALVNQPL